MLLLPLALLYCLSVPKASASWWAAQEVVTAANTSSQIRFISPLDNAVLGGKPSPAFDSTDTQRVEPEFHVYSSKFEKLLGPKAKVQRIVHVDGYAFAHEAPIWHKPTNELFFSSNAGGPLGYSGLNVSNRVLKLKLDELPEDEKPVNLTAHYIPLSPDLENVNGGIPYDGELLFLCQGRGGDKPSTLTRMNPLPPYNTSVLLDNFYGRQFNSLNDAAVVPLSRSILFTDPIYGFLQDFRPQQYMKIQTYRFDPSTGDIRAVADENPMPNGIAVSPDGTKAYIADTGSHQRTQMINQPASIYEYDLVYAADGAEQLKNRRLLAYVHSGMPDGIKVDVHGNIYAGCGDGVHVFSPFGELIGKIYLGQHSANLAFVEKGLIILSETDIYYAEMEVKGFDLDFWRS